MPADHERFIRLAIDEADKGGAEGNSAVGSIIVENNTVIGVGRNLVGASNDPTAHAETVALRETAAALGRSDFSGCALYTTFQPCPMCSGAIMVSGISTVVMGARPNPGESQYDDFSVEKLFQESGWGSKIEVVSGILTEECWKIRRDWAAKNGLSR
jgi:tRNA(adenine34) deaminase